MSGSVRASHGINSITHGDNPDYNRPSGALLSQHCGSPTMGEGHTQWKKVIHNAGAMLPVIIISNDRQYHINHSFTENVPQTKW